MPLPETVMTPMGEQSFNQAVRWHLPTMLRWIDENRDATYVPGGDLVGSILRIAAERIERLTANQLEDLLGVDLQHHPDKKILDRLDKIEIMLGIKEPPVSIHQWRDIYRYNGHYADGRQCRLCNIEEVDGMDPVCKGSTT